jgi:hypothetical protein
MSQLSKAFLYSMVQAMYKYEAGCTAQPHLLTDEEMMDFYRAYMGR